MQIMKRMIIEILKFRMQDNKTVSKLIYNIYTENLYKGIQVELNKGNSKCRT